MAMAVGALVIQNVILCRCIEFASDHVVLNEDEFVEL